MVSTTTEEGNSSRNVCKGGKRASKIIGGERKWVNKNSQQSRMKVREKGGTGKNGLKKGRSRKGKFAQKG